jgi:hypothetical protein
VASVSAQNYTANDCLVGFGGLDFDTSSYERYDEYFRDDSVMTLAQAGRYIGPEDIEEYVQFGDTSTPEHISFYESAVRIATVPQFKGVSDDGTCEFLILVTDQFNTSATISRASTHNAAIMTRIFYELSDKKVSSLSLSYSQLYLDFFFVDLLNTARTRIFICSVLEDDCPDTYARNTGEFSTEGSISKPCLSLLGIFLMFTDIPKGAVLFTPRSLLTTLRTVPTFRLHPKRTRRAILSVKIPLRFLFRISSIPKTLSALTIMSSLPHL